MLFTFIFYSQLLVDHAQHVWFKYIFVNPHRLIMCGYFMCLCAILLVHLKYGEQLIDNCCVMPAIVLDFEIHDIQP